VAFSHPIFLFFAALLAGLLNAVAGGGSFISFPALLFSGIAPIAANATNTVAVWPGTVASTVAYRKEFTPEVRRMLPPLIVTGILGGIIGARVLLITPQSTFMRIVPWLLLGATLLFAASGRLTARLYARLDGAPDRKGNEAATSASNVARDSATAQHPHKTPRWLFLLGLFLELLISIYIGYFGAGVGILLLALLALMGMENIHAMNGLKTLLVSIVNGVALVTFIFARVIVWPQALLMVVGASAGGYFGAYYGRKMNQQQIRWLVIVVGLSMSAYFFVRG
jgi:uncharacterized membrane protein YfcA